jgi:hypothetical protein
MRYSRAKEDHPDQVAVQLGLALSSNDPDLLVDVSHEEWMKAQLTRPVPSEKITQQQFSRDRRRSSSNSWHSSSDVDDESLLHGSDIRDTGSMSDSSSQAGNKTSSKRAAPTMDVCEAAQNMLNMRDALYPTAMSASASAARGGDPVELAQDLITSIKQWHRITEESAAAIKEFIKKEEESRKQPQPPRSRAFVSRQDRPIGAARKEASKKPRITVGGSSRKPIAVDDPSNTHAARSVATRSRVSRLPRSYNRIPETSSGSEG